MKKVICILMLASLGFASDVSVAKGSLEYAIGLYKHKKFEPAYKDFSQLCANKNEVACSYKNIMLFNGEGVKADKNAALTGFKNGCEKGEMMACGKLGELYAMGFEKVELEKKNAVLKKACDGGYKPACDLL